MVKRVLWQKTARDLWQHKGSVLALAAIVAVGVGVFAGMAALHLDLDEARRSYYADKRIAQFAIDLKRAPQWAVDFVRDDPRVSQARGRVQTSVLIDLPYRERPIPGRVLSLPRERRPIVNDVLPRSGVWFQNKRDVLLLESFANAVGISPGDRIRVTLLDKQHELLVVGTVMSPEFVYVIPPGGGFAPDPSRFGVLYLTEEFAREACDLRGAYNSIVGRAYRPDPDTLGDILDRAKRRLDPYGVLSVTPYEEMSSVRYLLDEIDGLKKTATIMPVVFLGVAALVLNVLLGRLVQQQRSIIGTLKALGYSSGMVLRHYLAFGIAVGLVGAVLGIGLAAWIQSAMISMYRQFFAMPGIVSRPHPDIVATAVGVSVFFACLGALKGVRYANRLEPAEAMSPPPPEKGGAILLERVGALWKRLGFRPRMAARSAFRNPFRSIVSILAAAISAALILSALSMSTSLDYLMRYTFDHVLHQDVTVATREPMGAEAIDELRRLPSVSGGEAELTITCELRNGAHEKRTGVTGIAPGARLDTPLDDAGRPIAIPQEGLVLSDKLAQILGLAPGDTVLLRPMIGERREVSALVARTVKTFLGLSAYADIRYLSRLVGEQEAANTFLLTQYGGPGETGFLHEVKRRPTVVGLSERRRLLNQIQETFGQTMGVSIAVMVLFAGLIAFGSVVNAAIVSVGERRREVGTLRVLGYTAPQVAAVFSLESLTLNGIGLGLGLCLGWAMAQGLSAAYNTELYRFPAIIGFGTVAWTIVLMLAFVGTAQWIIFRMVRKLDWLSVLSVKE